MKETSMTCLAKSGTHGSLSCVDLPCSERRVVITTPPEQNHFLSGLTKSIIVETGDKRNEAMSSSPAAGEHSTFAKSCIEIRRDVSSSVAALWRTGCY